MASGVLRNAFRRHLSRGLCSYTKCLWRPIKESSSCEQALAESRFSISGFRLTNYPVSTVGCITHSFTLPYKYLSTNSMNPEGPSVEKHVKGTSNKGEKKHDEVTSTGEEKAEESHQAEARPVGKPIRRGPVTWLSLLLLILTGEGLLYYFDYQKKRHIEALNTASTAVKEGPSVGKAAIGGPFKLVNHDGKTVTDRDFLGKWTLIYFGFTHCPDICPDELQKLANAVDKIKAISGIEIVPVFISVDPERDTVEQVGQYVKEFHPNLIGLTGNVDDIRQVARAYRLYYMKTEEEGSDYLVDHSIFMYLMDPHMEFVQYFGKNYDVETLAAGVIKEVKQHKK